MAKFSEWELKNFTCWSGDIHSERLTNRYGITLYPTGCGGKDNLVVTMRMTIYDARELSFIGSDGSVLCTRRPLTEWEGNSGAISRRTIFVGPKFEEVVAGIRGNEPMHKDRLILRWETKQGSSHQQFCTVIDAYSAFFYIKPEVYREWYNMSVISEMTCKLFGNEYKSIKISACETVPIVEDQKVKFILESHVGKKILVRTTIWMINGDKVMQKQEHNSILKDHGEILPNGIPLKELRGLKIIICCKIIPGESMEHFHYDTDFPLPPDLRIEGFSRFPEIKSMGNVVAALTTDLMCLYEDHNFSDFELRCGTVSFPAHRNILSARSPVLKAMLSGNMREATSGHVDIDDLDPHTLGRFLAFLYSGTGVEDLEWREAIKLYYAADMYQVPSLKVECTAVLAAVVSLENVCHILSLAEQHQDEELRSVAHDFILKDYDQVLGSKSWNKFMSSDPLLVAKTLTHFATNKYVTKSELITEKRCVNHQDGERTPKRPKM